MEVLGVRIVNGVDRGESSYETEESRKREESVILKEK